MQILRGQRALGPQELASCQASLPTTFPKISEVQEWGAVVGMSRELEANCIFLAMSGHF